NNRHYEMSEFLITQHLRQHANEDHRGRCLAIFSTSVELLEDLRRHFCQRLAAINSLRNVSAQFLTTLTQIRNFRRIVRWTIEREVLDLFIRQRNAET